MNGEALEILGVDAELLLQRAEFFEAEGRALDEGAAGQQRLNTHSDWTTDACVATAYRYAAQYAILVDVSRARRLLLESAERYSALGTPYGYFLMAAADPERLASRIFEEGPQRMSLEYGDGARPLARAALGIPVQLAYFLLSLHARGVLAREFSAIRETAMTRARAHESTPIGPEGVPIKRYLDFTDFLAADTMQGIIDEEGVVRLAQRTVAGLAPLARQYAENIEQARANRYLWERLQAPVDVVDLDIAGMAALASGLASEMRPIFADTIEGLLRELSPLERVSIAAGMGLGEAEAVPA